MKKGDTNAHHIKRNNEKRQIIKESTLGEVESGDFWERERGETGCRGEYPIKGM